MTEPVRCLPSHVSACGGTPVANSFVNPRGLSKEWTRAESSTSQLNDSTQRHNSWVPTARTANFDRKSGAIHRSLGGSITTLDVKATDRFVVDQLKGNVFINEYLVIKDLGRGSHGSVKLVYNTADDMLYAMKVMRSKKARKVSCLFDGRSPRHGSEYGTPSNLQPQNAGQIARDVFGLDHEFANEIQVMMDLDHENVTKLYEVIASREHTKLLMVMEYMEGGSVMQGDDPFNMTPLPEATALNYFRDVLTGLEYLHFNRIVHGDLKPDNFLLTMSASVKISDFGSARLCATDDLIYSSQGTPAFMPPEACGGKPFHGFSADIWSLGVSLYMFLYGTLPFGSGHSTVYQMYDSIQNQQLSLPFSRKGGKPISEQVRMLLERMLEKDPQNRASLEEIIEHQWVAPNGSKRLQRSLELGINRVMGIVRKGSAAMQGSLLGTLAKSSAPRTLSVLNGDQLHDIIPEGVMRTYTRGQEIVRRGEVPEGLFFILKGQVEVVRSRDRRRYVEDIDFADNFSGDDSSDSSHSNSDEEELMASLHESLRGVLGPMGTMSRRLSSLPQVYEEGQAYCPPDNCMNRISMSQGANQSSEGSGLHQLPSLSYQGSRSMLRDRQCCEGAASIDELSPLDDPQTPSPRPLGFSQHNCWRSFPNHEDTEGFGETESAGGGSNISLPSMKSYTNTAAPMAVCSPSSIADARTCDLGSPVLIDSGRANFSSSLHRQYSAGPNGGRPLAHGKGRSCRSSLGRGALSRWSAEYTSSSPRGSQETSNGTSGRSLHKLNFITHIVEEDDQPLFLVEEVDLGGAAIGDITCESSAPPSQPPTASKIRRKSLRPMPHSNSASTLFRPAERCGTNATPVVQAASATSGPLYTSTSTAGNVPSGQCLIPINRGPTYSRPNLTPPSTSPPTLAPCSPGTSQANLSTAAMAFSSARRASTEMLSDGSSLPRSASRLGQSYRSEAAAGKSAGTLLGDVAVTDIPGKVDRSSCSSVEGVGVEESNASGEQLSGNEILADIDTGECSMFYAEAFGSVAPKSQTFETAMSGTLSLYEPTLAGCSSHGKLSALVSSNCSSRCESCTESTARPRSQFATISGEVPPERGVEPSASNSSANVQRHMAVPLAAIEASRAAAAEASSHAEPSCDGAAVPPCQGSAPRCNDSGGPASIVEPSPLSQGPAATSSTSTGSRSAGPGPRSQDVAANVISAQRRTVRRNPSHPAAFYPVHAGPNFANQCNGLANRCAQPTPDLYESTGSGRVQGTLEPNQKWLGPNQAGGLLRKHDSQSGLLNIITHSGTFQSSATIFPQSSQPLPGVKEIMMASLTTPCESNSHALTTLDSSFKRAISRTESMHRRMAVLVQRAKQHASKEERSGKKFVVSIRGPGNVVGDVFSNDTALQRPSGQSALAKSASVTMLLLRHEDVMKHANKPVVRAAINRSRNALLVQDALERFIECESEVKKAHIIRCSSSINWPSDIEDPNTIQQRFSILSSHANESICSARTSSCASIHNVASPVPPPFPWSHTLSNKLMNVGGPSSSMLMHTSGRGSSQGSAQSLMFGSQLMQVRVGESSVNVPFLMSTTSKLMNVTGPGQGPAPALSQNTRLSSGNVDHASCASDPSICTTEVPVLNRNSRSFHTMGMALFRKSVSVGKDVHPGVNNANIPIFSTMHHTELSSRMNTVHICQRSSCDFIHPLSNASPQASKP